MVDSISKGTEFLVNLISYLPLPFRSLIHLCIGLFFFVVLIYAIKELSG